MDHDSTTGPERAAVDAATDRVRAASGEVRAALDRQIAVGGLLLVGVAALLGGALLRRCRVCPACGRTGEIPRGRNPRDPWNVPPGWLRDAGRLSGELCSPECAWRWREGRRAGYDSMTTTPTTMEPT